MCLLGMGAVLNVEVSSVSGGGVGECRRGCSRVMVAIFTKAVVIPTRGDCASLELIDCRHVHRRCEQPRAIEAYGGGNKPKQMAVNSNWPMITAVMVEIAWVEVALGRRLARGDSMVIDKLTNYVRKSV